MPYDPETVLDFISRGLGRYAQPPNETRMVTLSAGDIFYVDATMTIDGHEATARVEFIVHRIDGNTATVSGKVVPDE